jgi:adenosylcobinamide-GDP ribazoletransferase
LKFIAAWRFLILIPLNFKRANTNEEISGSIVYFPVIGLILGLVLAGLAWVFRLGFPASIVSILVLLVLTVLTGGLHLDGLADSFDGLGGKDREERLRIMRDSQHGTFGIVSVIFALFIQATALATISSKSIYWAIIVFPIIGRWAMVYALAAYPYARESGMGVLFKKNATVSIFAICTVFTMAVTALLLHGRGMIALIAALAAVMLVAAFFNRRLAGLTGDSYGALNVIGEATFLLVIALLSYNGWLLA